MRARRQDQELSPWHYWQHEHRRVLRELLTRRDGALTTLALRETLYRQVKECTQFKPSLALAVYVELRATRILDFSAGWGDRLVAALACADVQRYLAFDPNTSLRAGHTALIERFADNNAATTTTTRRRRFDVIYEPFERATLPVDESFDLVFTSPPFFDFETYTQLPGQSASTYPQRDAWLVGFLFAALAKAWRALDDGGHLAVHIVDVFKTQVCEPMNLFAQWRLPGARYRGVIASRGGAGKPRPIWVWRKDLASPASSTRVEQAGNDLRRYFPSVHRRCLDAEQRQRQQQHH